MVCVFKHLYCSTQLSMSSMEKRYRNKIIKSKKRTRAEAMAQRKGYTPGLLYL